MIDFNNLINDIITTKISCITSLKLFLFIIFALIISLIIDMAFGELPTRIHPVVVMGSIINFFKRLFIGIKNRISGLFVVVGVYLVSIIILYLIYLICS